MNARPASRWIALSFLSACALLLLTVSAGLGVDRNSNGVSDLWELLYPGSTNVGESLWGDPQNPGLTTVNLNTNTGLLEISWRSIAGKRYQLQSRTNLLLGSWTNDGSFLDGLTNIAYFTNSRAVTTLPKYYRVNAFDKDTDGDGVSDWEEYRTGLNVNSTNSNVDGIPDGAYFTNQLALPNTVTIQATQPFASKDGPQPGMFTISRAQKLLPVTINLARTGTAIPGTDFAGLPSSITFAPGVAVTNIAVNPVPNNALTGNRSVSLALAPGGSGSGFTLNIFSNATVIINESTAPSGSGLLARYYDTASTTYIDAANFGQSGTYSFTRSNSPLTNLGSITIPFTNITALAPGNLVKVSFTSGNLNNATYNHSNYVVSTVTNGTSFTLAINNPSGLPASGVGSCSFSIQSFPHPAQLTRVDPTVDFNWLFGTPNGVSVTPNNPADNYSASWEGYLNPTNAGSYEFLLDADDRARVYLDLNDGNGLQQILDHNWGTPSTNGVFNRSAAYNLIVPTTPTNRYRMRVEFVETTNDATCRLQWRLNGGNSNNIPQGQVFTHTAAMTYGYTRTVTNAGAMAGTIIVTNAHSFSTNDIAQLYFSTGNLFTPANGNFHGGYTVIATNTNSFTVGISNASLPASGNGAGFVMGRTNSTTTGLFNLIYGNTNFAGAPGRVGVDSAVTAQNNGLWGTGTPDASLIQPDTFSVRWSGQVQPQFSEDYIFVVNCDDGCVLYLNGQAQPLRVLPSAVTTGSTYVYNPTNGDLVVNYAGLIVVSNSFIVGETVRLDPTSGLLLHNPATSPTYTYNTTNGVVLVDYSNLTNVVPGSYVNGETVELDPTSGTLTSLTTFPYVISNATATTFEFNVGPGAGAGTNGSGNITIADTRNSVITAATATNFTVNIGLGKYTNSAGTNSTGNISIDIVDKQLKDWANTGVDRYVKVPMIGGTRYDLQLDYFENTVSAKCQLFWYSPSQPRQIIPSTRLYPANAPLAPASFTGDTDATVLVGGLFSYNVRGNGTNVTVSGLPAWLSFVNGVLSGTPPPGTEGEYQIVITTANAAGSSTSVLNLHVTDTGRTITREYWNGVAGTNVSSIPVSSIPTGTNSLTNLMAATDFGDNYGARIRGYITAPVSGNYYFWIAASDSAELWISNDEEPVNAFKRAWVTTGTTPTNWNAFASQKSPWMALEGGKKYYIEILHKAGTGAGDNLAVGWLKPGESGNAPSEIVPGYVISPYVPASAASNPGTLYIATMLAQPGVVSSGVGSATLRLSPDENTAYLKFSYNGLTSVTNAQHVHSEAYQPAGTNLQPSAIIYDIDTPATMGDGLITDPNDPNYGFRKWTIAPVGGLSKSNIVEIIKQGKSYINIHTVNYPDGEIRGNFTLANGTRTFTPPPAPPTWTTNDNRNNIPNAVRFLTQATFGANPADIAALTNAVSYEAWIDDQFTKPPTYHLPEVLAREIGDAFGPFDVKLTFNTWWKSSISAQDQLRQRIAFALSQIHVVSASGPLEDNSRAISHFYDQFLANAFGNFRDILVTTTLTPGMGRYLDMLRNDKPDLSVGRSPNENYAREIMQLFSIGLYRMWPDGTLMLTSKDEPIDTYTQREIVGVAHVFTGWDYGYDGPYRTSLGANADWTRLMREVPARHFTGAKRVLNNEVLPGLPTLGGQPLDPYGSHISSEINDPLYRALPGQELDAVHDQLFNHPNVGPFICRQLIQRLVTSDPSRDYLYRVVQKFNDNGSGVRGDMKAVIKAILLDYAARSTESRTLPDFGKQREPIMRVAAAARAFRPTAPAGTYQQNGSNTITIATTTPHLLQQGDPIFLEFNDTTGDPLKPAPTDALYTVVAVNNATNYTINAPGWAVGTYNQPSNSSVMTISIANHWLPGTNALYSNGLPSINWGKAYFDFTSGPANGIAGLDNTNFTTTSSTSFDTASGVGNVAGTTFTITAPITNVLRSGTVMIPRFGGSYNCTDPNGLITIDTAITVGGAAGYGNMADHHLNPGDKVFLNFLNTRDTTSGDPTSTDNDLEYTIVDVPDSNTFRVAARGAPNARMNSDNQVAVFPLKSQPLVRNGTINTRLGTFNMGNTDVPLAQTPLNSPTVFNYFLPEYKFPGALASAGMTTPEFQLTAETTVIRQANYLYDGVFSDNTNGVNSFTAGSGALVMDFTPWMGLASNAPGIPAGPAPTQVWTSDTNLPTLFDRLNNLLVAGQMNATAKSNILNAITNRTMTITSTNNPVVITKTAHGLANGDTITISGVTGGTFSPSINGTFTVSNVTATTFTVPVSCSSLTGLNVTSARFSPIAYTDASPTTSQKSDRIKAMVHLILTSPDLSIQR